MESRILAAVLAVHCIAFSVACAAAQQCASQSDSEATRKAEPSEIQVLWSKRVLTYANTTDLYAACSYTVGGAGGDKRVETYLKPGQSVTRRGVSGINSNPAHCTVYTVKPCDADDHWDG